MSAGDDGKEIPGLSTLTVLMSLFSWELEGSIASLLGTGVVVVVRLETSIELALVVSFRHWGDVSLLLVDAGLVDGEGLAPLVLPAAAVLEKKPRMLCCLPVEAAFFAVDGVFAGVRAGVAPILSFTTTSPCQFKATICVRIKRERMDGQAVWCLVLKTTVSGTRRNARCRESRVQARSCRECAPHGIKIRVYPSPHRPSTSPVIQLVEVSAVAAGLQTQDSTWTRFV